VSHALRRTLVVTSDDLGMTLAVNRGIEAAIDRGALTSTNVMVPCPWFEHAAQRFATTPVDLGIHLTLTCEWSNYTWRPLTSARSLLDGRGRMYRTIAELMRHAEAEDIRAECHAQLAIARDRGLRPSYVDLHMCIPTLERRSGAWLAANPEHELALMRLIDDVAREAGLEYPYALDGGRLRHFTSALSISGKGRAAVERYITDLEPGVHHLSCHCALDADEQNQLSPADAPEHPWSLPFRRDDFETVTSAWFAALLRANEVELTGMPWRRHSHASRALA
jgi:hypothetical protein